jgi:hypothetical protein
VPEPEYPAVVGDGLRILGRALEPFVTRVLVDVLPASTTWPQMLQAKDTAERGHAHGIYAPTDVALHLRAMTERLGDLGYPFTYALGPLGRGWASELRTVRNAWAHNEPFSSATCLRALDTMSLLLDAIAADDEAAEIEQLKLTLITPQPAPVEPATEVGRVQEHPVVAPADADAVTIELDARSVLSYPMANSRIPIVTSVTVASVSGHEYRESSLELEVVCATGSLGGPKVHMVDVLPQTPTTLADPHLILDPQRMLAIDEQVPGRLVATLRDREGRVVGRSERELQVLAHNQWQVDPARPAMSFELLVAHVQPNAAAIAPILREASDRLRDATGSSALDPFPQDGDPKRVDAVVEAVWDAMRARSIRYAYPPASWDAEGQKVRTPAEVLDGRLGTCLDTTVTLAAVLEELGINSTLWLVKEHIFLGYWRSDQGSLGVTATPDFNDVINLVDMERIRPVETTLATGGEDSADFATAIERATQMTHSDIPMFAIMDVRAARQHGIYPLASRAIGDDGATTVSVYQPAAAPLLQKGDYVGLHAVPQADPDVPDRVRRWKNALLDLSLRNRLINYTDSAGYRLEVPEGSVDELENMINAGKPIGLVPSDAIEGVEHERGLRTARDIAPAQRTRLLVEKSAAFVEIGQAAYTSKLRYLAYKAKTIAEETGANNLYLALGTLHWKLDDRELRSPLVLVPISLTSTSRGERYRITLDEAGASTPNYCLLEKLRVSFNLQIPGLANPEEDASGIDLAGAFRAVREAIAAAGLPFRVEESAHLSILQFAKFRLWKDLDENWREFAGNSLVQHLIANPLDVYADPVDAPADVDLDDLGARSPVSADSSQLDAVAEAIAGRTFVLEGPPGTGKSQTITNLLARALVAGKRVLFVAEKRAALEVVKKRLDAVGLGDLSLDLHDKGARPAAARAQIKRALELRSRGDATAFSAALESADASRRGLQRYAERLHEDNAAGLSLYGARDRLLAGEADVPVMEVPADLVASGTPETFERLRSVLRTLPDVADPARPARRHPWGFIDAAGADPAAAVAASARLDAAIAALTADGVSLSELLDIPSPVGLRGWAEVDPRRRFPLTGLDTVHADGGIRRSVDEIAHELGRMSAERPAWTAIFAPSAAATIPDAALQAAVAADQSGFFGRKRRRRTALELMAPHLLVDRKAVPLKELSAVLGEVVASARQAEEVRIRVRALPVAVAQEPWNPWEPEQASAPIPLLGDIGWLTDHLGSDADPVAAIIRRRYASSEPGRLAVSLTELADAWTAVLAFPGVDTASVDTWRASDGFLAAWTTTASQRDAGTGSTIGAGRWLALLAEVEPLRAAGLVGARREILTGAIPSELARLAFEQGVAAASIGERGESTTLADFDAAAHERTITRFTESTGVLRALLPHQMPADILDLRRFDSESGIGMMGGLRRQLDRQRGGMSVRTLIENYGELITQILPCTLMSPESVARFFPAHADIFDVVVFDEASQIRVADAVGAMGRGRSVVVVGDSRQMPPTSFAESNGGVDEAEDQAPDVVLDEESILTECVQARVPRKWLSWHYRSQDEALIAFSNRYYYDDRLSSFPAPFGTDEQHADHGVRLVRVSGVFERGARGKTLRTNRVEADAIVAEIRRRFERSPVTTPSLGVVTFNAQQRDLIENLLRDAGDERIRLSLDEPDGLFIKNLENVQGDERDTILFSIAFSANEKGELPLNFGPITRAGGERRLNVAITRARREVVLFASFDPEQIRAENTASVGVKHLRAYLELARSGAESLGSADARRSTVDRHRDEIAGELRLRGLAVATDVGLSDFRVDLSIATEDQPNRPMVAVLLDGPGWRSRRTVADRDRLPREVLRDGMKWPGVERVWLPEWLEHREAVLARLEVAVATAAAAPDPEPEPAPTMGPVGAVDAPTVGVRPDADVRAPSIGDLRATGPVTRTHPDRATFSPWTVRSVGSLSDLDALPHGSAAYRVASTARQVVIAEGPVSPSRLARQVAAAFGLSRVFEQRQRAILAEVPRDLLRQDAEGFFWPDGTDPSSWTTARSGARPLDEIALEEIANAMHIVAEESGGLPEAEILRAALNVFGGTRMTDGVTARLRSGLRVALARNVVRESRDGWFTA